MTTNTALDKLDVIRRVRLARAAYESQYQEDLAANHYGAL
jgi:hypothetical protein